MPNPSTPQERREAVARIKRAVEVITVENVIGLSGKPLRAFCDDILAALDALPTQPTDEAVRGLVDKDIVVAALRLAEDVLSRSPNSNRIWITEAGEVHPGTGINLIREAIDTALIRSQSAEIARLQALPLEGLVVPVEPTEEMIKAADALDVAMREQGFANADVAGVWAAMLQAAPSAPLVGGFGSGSSPDGDTQPAVEGPSGHRGWSWNYDLTHVPRAETVLFLGQRDGDGLERVWLTDCPNGPDENAVAWLSLPGAESAPLSPSQPVIRAGDET